MRLGWDLDGVLADLESGLRCEVQRLWPGRETSARAVPPSDDQTGDESSGDLTDDERKVTPPALELSSTEQRELWRAVRDVTNFWDTLGEIEVGMVQRLAELTRTRRWEVIFLTSRPRCQGDTVQVQSQRWLTRHGFEYPCVFVVKGSRGKIADALALDVVIDDRPENCLDVVLDSKARAVLIWRGGASNVPASARRHGIGDVTSVAACLDILEQADSPSSEPSIVERLKRLLGIKSSTEPTATARGSTDRQ